MDKNKGIHEWMNEQKWMNEWTKWMNEQKWMNEWMDKSEWMNKK